jgi:hypothetical protein
LVEEAHWRKHHVVRSRRCTSGPITTSASRRRARSTTLPSE